MRIATVLKFRTKFKMMNKVAKKYTNLLGDSRNWMDATEKHLLEQNMRRNVELSCPKWRRRGICY
jgi:hypothetical protein